MGDEKKSKLELTLAFVKTRINEGVARVEKELREIDAAEEKRINEEAEVKEILAKMQDLYQKLQAKNAWAQLDPEGKVIKAALRRGKLSPAMNAAKEFITKEVNDATEQVLIVETKDQLTSRFLGIRPVLVADRLKAFLREKELM